ncbi:MAG: metallophosphoesterase family protein [Polyangiales bacterium]
MASESDRRDFLSLLSLGGVVVASGLAGCAGRSPPAATSPASGAAAAKPARDFFFLQLSDTHVGYVGAANPESERTLAHAVETIVASSVKPDFVVFTGDLTHTTDDPGERRSRMRRFSEAISRLDVPIRFLPGEHDAAPDHGEAYVERFGALTSTFDHEGVHFVALDNASMPGGEIGTAQLGWLEDDLHKLDPATPLVVLAHRPLFDLQLDWEWATKDGARAIELLSKRENVTVFHGHIHQELHRQTGAIAHHSARSLVFPLPAPGSVPKKAPLPWDAASEDHGLGWRSIACAHRDVRATEVPYRGRRG